MLPNYFWVYVNGQNTGVKVTSNGRREIHLVKIVLNRKDLVLHLKRTMKGVAF